MEEILITEYQREKIKKEKMVYDVYMKLRENPINSKTEIVRRVMSKFNIHAPSTVYAIVRRVEGRIAATMPN